MRDPLVVLELVAALVLGVVGSVFLTAAPAVIKERGVRAWALGLAATIALVAAWWQLDDAAGSAAQEPGRYVLVLAAVMGGIALAAPLRKRVLRVRTGTPPPPVALSRP